MRSFWTSIDPARNRFRFYTLFDSVDLWGQRCIIRRWGRLDGRVVERIDWMADEL